jgi:hypothetical protein
VYHGLDPGILPANKNRASCRGMLGARTLAMAPSGRSSLDDVIDAYKEGIDVTLIDANLRRSVDERLRELQRLLEFSDELQRAGRTRPPTT